MSEALAALKAELAEQRRRIDEVHDKLMNHLLVQANLTNDAKSAAVLANGRLDELRALVHSLLEPPKAPDRPTRTTPRKSAASRPALPATSKKRSRGKAES
jgi:small-conductance mechanosensitive channel